MKQIERPSKLRQYYPGTWQGILKYILIFTPVSVFILWCMYTISLTFDQPYVDSTHVTGYDLLGNAVVWIFAALIFSIPELVGLFTTLKTERPSYGFATLIGFFCGGIIFTFIFDKGWGLYMIFMTAALFFLQIIPHHHYTFRWGDIIYYLFYGILICYITFMVTEYFMDIWSYLQLLYTCVMFVMILGNKIRQWGYAYLMGWVLCSLYILIFSNALLGIYFLISSILLNVALFGIFAKWRSVGDKAKIRE
jgi:hypothetical protein